MTQPFGTTSISVWLEEIGFSKYKELFRVNEIDLDVLVDLTNEDYRELEIPLGDRKKLLKAIALLPGANVQQPSAPTTATERDAAGDADVERRQITVLFCDLTGSTEMSNRLDIEDLADSMRDFQKSCAEIVERGGGFVARYQGDAILAYFGWPRAQEDDAERCVRTGLEMVAAIGQMRASDGTPLLARVGIATGLVMIGELIGEGLSREKAVVGATPNLAARLESLAQPGTVAISATTARLIGDQFKLHNLGVHELKGFPEPEQVWCVDAEREVTSRFGVRLLKGLTPLVGRKGETDVIHELWGKVLNGSGQVAVVVGEAGIGKSRLVRSLDIFQKDDNHVKRLYQCHAFHANSALHPVIEQLRRLTGIQTSDAPRSKLKKLEKLMASMGLASLESIPLMASLLSISWEGYYPALNLSPQLQSRKTIDLVIGILTWTRPATPLELVFEDIHWADPSTLQVIHRLIGQIEDMPIMLVITYRPEFEGTWPDLPYLTALDLRRLSQRQVKAMVKRIAGNKELPEEIMESIITTTDGVPLFVEELTKTILESGQLREESNSYQSQGGSLHISIPATLRDSLAARLDQLTVGRELAQVGATIGRLFSTQLAGFILKMSEIELREPVTHLTEAGIIERRGSPTHGQYFFKHALFQEVAYRSQLKSRRREIHLQIANALESYFPEVVEGLPETLARHFEEAGSITKAAGYLLQAGGKSLHVAATREAIAHLTRGLDLVVTLPQNEARDLALLRFHATLGTAYMLAKGWASSEVELAYSEANKVIYAATDAAEAIWILWGIWVYRHVRGQINESIPISDRITATALKNAEPSLKLVADMVMLQVCFYGGRFDRAVQYCDAVRTGFNPEQHRGLLTNYSTDLELVAQVHQSIACWIRGQFDEALRIAGCAEALARKLEHPYSISWMLLWGATPLLLQGKLEKLTGRLDEGIAIAEEQGFAYAVAMGDIFSGWVIGQKGDLEGGISKMQHGLTSFRKTGAEIAVPHFNTLLADMHRKAGNTADALVLLDAAEQQVKTWGECWQESEIYRVRGEVLASAAETDFEAAEHSFRRAIDVASRQKANGWLLRAALGLANLQVAEDKLASAYETLSPVFRSIDTADSMADYTAAKTLIGQLSD